MSSEDKEYRKTQHRHRPKDETMQRYKSLDFTYFILEWDTWNKNISKYELIEEDECYGIVFTIDNVKYEIINSIHMGYRIFIYDDKGSCQDIPFSKKTQHFLPEDIKLIIVCSPCGNNW